MIVPIRPPLSGISAQRYLALARTLGQTPLEDEPQRRRLLRDEVHWCRTQPGLDQTRRLTYTAVAHLLVDLHRMGWRIREAGYGIELVAKPVRLHGLMPADVLAQKAQTRAMFRPAVAAQLGDPAVRQFVRRLEQPDARSGKRPVTLLIADGAELHARLRAPQASADAAGQVDSILVQPYLQLASSDAIDSWTGHGLREIWRYFRYTWSIPQTTTPGRQLLYLVRDAAHPCHAVMGLIGLNNSALQMGALRERDLGWSREALIESLHNAAATGDGERLQSEYAWMEARIADALSDVATDGLVTDDEQAAPTPAVIARLRHAARDFDQSRDATLRRIKQPRVEDGIEPLFAWHPPVSDAMLNLEPKPASDPIMQQARRYLVARKRATLLAELLQARLTLREARDNLCDPCAYPAVVTREAVGIALQTVLDTLKSRYAGINLLEVSTCGAIAPYNHILGGKLAALLLFSPEIADDYRRLYSGPSIIASQLKNAEVRRDATLVYLATTSLYAAGSSQYERVRLPARIISYDQAPLKFSRLGLSQGYGTLQFMTETRAAVEDFLQNHQAFRDVNSIFGEGPSPKFRKFTAAMARLGFPPDELMLHHRPRIIYGAPLMTDVRGFLTGRLAAVPEYITEPGQYRDATAKIAAYWRERWLLKRRGHGPSMTALMLEKPWRVGDRIPLAETHGDVDMSDAQTPTPETNPANENLGEREALWREIAKAGSRSVSDNLAGPELDRMHVDLHVEPLVLELVQKGVSVFLTGNAGDGKTHILRRLRDELQQCGAVVIEDATATMRKDQLGTVLEKWRDAHRDRRPFCIAINEYPLHLLKVQAQEILPELAQELDRQARERLIYGLAQASEEFLHNVVLVDLSLRNPLSPSIALEMLRRLLGELSVSNVDLNTDIVHSSTLNRLSLNNQLVQERLRAIFARTVDIGGRLTMRELWILVARMVFGYRADLAESYGDHVDYRYSDILFSSQPHFREPGIFAAADPSSYSHPYWDAVLEERQPSSRAGWMLRDPEVGPADRLDRSAFRALKRLFYFEHADGEACFEREDPDLSAFRDLLQAPDDDLRAKRQLVAGLNRAFCPVPFAGAEDNLYLWNGHRFHEQPTRSFLADRFVSVSDLRLLKPRLPARVAAAFPDYRPDHLVLEAAFSDEERVRLRLDFLLFRSLQRLRRGLPRKLLSEDEAFRLDRFVEVLSRYATIRDRRILSIHLDRRELLEVELSVDKLRYEGIRRHGEK
jgi:hypothetical protein